jgi:putative OPT family oligopeptide transporter
MPEITLKGIILAIILSFILAVSNAYLALKIGILISASIPAAIISMGVLRLFNQSNILENNLVQTAASAGEAVAGGIVYTIPALIIMHYWTGFDYWHNFLIALIGGVLGIMFSIPLRRILMNDTKLSFPEGRAIASVLKVSDSQQLGVKEVVYGCLISAFLAFCQSGVKLFASVWELWFKVGHTIMGFGVGFSPAMIGAGYLIGLPLTASIFIGALISWFFSIPLLGFVYPDVVSASDNANQIAQSLWGSSTRYIGIGAMLTAGLLTLFSLIKPIILSMGLSLKALRFSAHKQRVERTETDMPMHYVVALSLLSTVALFFLYQQLFPVDQLGLSSWWSQGITYSVLFYTLCGGFIFCVITAYFSGMVGVSASPGSSIIIAGLLIVAMFVFAVLRYHGYATFTAEQIKASEAITIICTAIITGMAAISNDNMQDLKVGHLLGATPWKQQVMLLLGVLCASLVIAPVMQMLYNVYGIAGVMPHAGMDASLSLPAPPAAVMAALTGAVFQQQIPWTMMFIGAGIVIIMALINIPLRQRGLPLSILGVAIGIYIPLASSMPLFIGGLIAWSRYRKKTTSHRDTMLACGLIAGASLLDVLLAIPLSLMKNPDALNLAPTFWGPIGILLSLASVVFLFVWFRRLANYPRNDESAD